MSDEKSNGRSDADDRESALSQPATPDHDHDHNHHRDHDAGAAQAGPTANYTPAEEARVVRKLDWNLMTLFFALCEWRNTA